jgi:hypothetical protein
VRYHCTCRCCYNSKTLLLQVPTQTDTSVLRALHCSAAIRECTAAVEAAERAAVDARSSAKLTDAKAAVTAARGRGGGAGAFARLQVNSYVD